MQNQILPILSVAFHILSEKITTMNENPSAIPVLLFNTLSWQRTECVEIELKFEEKPPTLSLIDLAGKDVPFQTKPLDFNGESRSIRVIFEATVPAFGYTQYFIIPCETNNESEEIPFVEQTIKLLPNGLENNLFRLEINRESGDITRLLDKRSQRNLIDPLQPGNRLVAIVDNGDSEGRFKKTSDIFPKPLGKRLNINRTPHADSNILYTIQESGPIRSVISIQKQFQNSNFTQELIFYKSIPRIDARLHIEWHDIHFMIKLLFPVSLHKPITTYSTQYAAIERPQDGIEYPMQQWLDISEADHGLGILNKARYAADVSDNTLGISILRSPTTPALNSDQGEHDFQYSLIPHIGTWRRSRLVQAGTAFNTPIFAFQTDQHQGSLAATQSFFEISASNIILEVLKQAYDSDEFVLRLYESTGSPIECILNSVFKIENAQETDLLEADIRQLEFEDHQVKCTFEKFEIKTLKLRIMNEFNIE